MGGTFPLDRVAVPFRRSHTWTVLPAGSEFGGYRLQGVLGHGGMGTVYEAVQLSLGRTVALKVLSPQLSADEEFRERFRREGRHQSAIDHEHIVTVYEAGEADGRLYLSMRLIRGATLKQLIEAGELEATRTLRLLGQVADALDAAHAAGLVHRDVKPQNVLVAPGDHAFLADFGLTRTTDQTALTVAGTYMGTLDYSSPEQLRGETAGSASDVYALAALAYECLTGTVPFPRPSWAAVIGAHLFDPPPRVRDTHPEMPVAIDAGLARGLAKDPAGRPTAGALVEELCGALDGVAPAAARSADNRGPSSSASSLIGRIDELAALESALERARGGQPQAVLLAGDAGMGKSRLVEELTSGAVAAGARVLSGACIDLGETTVPYAAVADALRAVPREALTRLPEMLRGDLAALVPEAATAAGIASQRSPSVKEPAAALFAAVLRLIEELGRETPLVVVLEDLHWADRSTHDLLRFLVRGLRDTAVLLVLTYRTDELRRRHPLRPLLAELQRSPRVVHVTLPVLTREETAAQMEAILGRAADAGLVERIHSRSEGNPFFTEELLAAESLELDVTAGLREALVTRVDRMSDSAQTLARIAAGVGRTVDHALLATVAELGDDALDAALRECLGEQILVLDADGTAYRFRHALIQEAVYRELLPGERQRLHRRIAEILSADQEHGAGPVPLGELAHHWHRARDGTRALAASVAAAGAAEKARGLAEASRLYDRALELWDTVTDAREVAGVDLAFVCERAGECRWLGLGDAGGAAALLERGLEVLPDDAPDLRRANLLSRLGMCAWELHGRPADGLGRHEQALALLGDEPSEVGARVLARYANTLLILCDFSRAEAAARKAAEMARSLGARREQADAVVTQLLCRGTAGDLEGALALIGEARDLVLAEPDAHVMKRFFTNASFVFNLFGRYEESVAIARDGVEVMEHTGLNRFGQLCVLENAAAALGALGRLDEAFDLISRDEGPLSADTRGLHVEFANLERLRGDAEAARAHLDLLAGIEDPILDVYAATLRADVDLWEGRLESALAAVQAGEAALVEADRGRAAQLLAMAVRVQAERAERDPALLSPAREEADRLLTRLRGVVAAGESPLPEPEAQLALAEAERSRLAPGFDPEPWRHAARQWEALARPYDVAYARWREARALTAAGAEPAELEAVVDAARAAAQAAGARRLLAEIEDVARPGPTVLNVAG